MPNHLNPTIANEICATMIFLQQLGFLQNPNNLETSADRRRMMPSSLLDFIATARPFFLGAVFTSAMAT